ncbi:DNA damage-binding protein cmr1 [Cytospora mali]|uniref:DNA damage-binding protein CMR1 n=1 Tax=Cytospora mali TaxID=578113 RepID=A0A194W6F7_CYTMA|nr:DNA damage-binding protein cmr1 [Valsa mali]
MPVKKEGEAMSTFEQRRLQNIADNNAILKGISKTAAKIAKPPPPPAPKSRPRAKRPTVEKKEYPKRERSVATRASSRLKGETPDKNGLKREADDSAHVALFPEKPAKKTRVNDDLNLGDILVEGRKFATDAGAFADLISLPRQGAEPGVRTFDEDDIKQTTDKELRALREEMGNLELYSKWAVNDIKIVPQRIYSMGFHPTADKPLIFAGDKEGAMGIFDASQDAPEVDDEDEDAEHPDPVIAAFKTHARTISSFHFPFTDPKSVYTASYDSSIRKLDLGVGTPVSVQMFAPEDDEDLPISAIDMAPNDHNTIIFSTLSGSVGRFDFRTRDDTEIWGLSDSKIGGFALHPNAPHLFATASLDRTMKIWDMRKVSGKGDMRHPALVGEHESRLSVSHASWSPAGHIATSSYDDTIKIYDFPESATWKVGHDVSGKDMKPDHIVKHNNQTGRWVTILKPQWQRRPADGIQKFAIGNMNRFVDVFGADGEQLAQLDGDGITAVPAVAHLHPTQNWVVGGTASGKVCLWM